MAIFKIPTFIINLLSVYTANALNGILGIIAVPLVVAALGNEGYGIYSIYIILASYIALVDFGVTKHFIRLMSSAPDKDKQSEYLQTAFGWYIILSVVLIFMLPALIYIVTGHLFPVPKHFRASANWIVIFSVAEYVLAIPVMLAQAYTVSNHEFKRYSSFLTLGGLVKYGLMFLAAWRYRDPAVVVLFITLRRFFELGFMRFLLLKPPRSSWKPRIDVSELKGILVNSSMMSLSQFLQISVISIGAVLVNRHFGVAVLGNYRAAFDLASKIWFFSNGLGLIVFPKFSQLLSMKSERESLINKMNLWLEKSWAGYLLISLLAVMCASWALPLVNLGDPGIVLFFKLLIFGFCLNAHTNVSYEYLLADNRYRRVAFLMVSVLIVLVAAYYSLVGISGPYAIGWAWIVSQTVYAFIADGLVIRTGSENRHRQRRSLILKILIFIMTLGSLFAGLGRWPAAMIASAPAAVILGAYVLIKDFDELKLFFK